MIEWVCVFVEGDCGVILKWILFIGMVVIFFLVKVLCVVFGNVLNFNVRFDYEII